MQQTVNRRTQLKSSLKIALLTFTSMTLLHHSTLVQGQSTTNYQGDYSSLQRHPRPQWWDDAKLGIFIHWGPYSVPAYNAKAMGQFVPSLGYAEWYWHYQQIRGTSQWFHHKKTYGESFTYDDFLPQFRASRFDATQWINLFRASGAKYWILATKHHDGFGMWHSKVSQRNSWYIGAHRDFLAELVNANKNSGLKSGVYYSIPEWFNPANKPRWSIGSEKTPLNTKDVISWLKTAYFSMAFTAKRQAKNAYTNQPVAYMGQNNTILDYANDLVRPQLTELITQYQPDILWCDGGGNEKYFKLNQIIAQYYNQSVQTNPEGVVVNDRCGILGQTHQDFSTVEYGSGKSVPPFEATYGIQLNTFGYASNEPRFLSNATLIEGLVAEVAKGGNLLINIGPTSTGEIPAPVVERLTALGKWLNINGQAIYASRPWSTQVKDGHYFTRGKDGSLYVITSKWPGAKLIIPTSIPTTTQTQVTLLGSDLRKLNYQNLGTQLMIELPYGDNPSLATQSEHLYTFRISHAYTP